MNIAEKLGEVRRSVLLYERGSDSNQSLLSSVLNPETTKGVRLISALKLFKNVFPQGYLDLNKPSPDFIDLDKFELSERSFAAGGEHYVYLLKSKIDPDKQFVLKVDYRGENLDAKDSVQTSIEQSQTFGSNDTFVVHSKYYFECNHPFKNGKTSCHVTKFIESEIGFVDVFNEENFSRIKSILDENRELVDGLSMLYTYLYNLSQQGTFLDVCGDNNVAIVRQSGRHKIALVDLNNANPRHKDVFNVKMTSIKKLLSEYSV